MSDDRPMGEDRPAASDSGPNIMQFAGLGLLLAVFVFAGLGLGWLADSLAGTLPVFLMVGLVAGIICGGLASRAQLRRW